VSDAMVARTGRRCSRDGVGALAAAGRDIALKNVAASRSPAKAAGTDVSIRRSGAAFRCTSRSSREVHLRPPGLRWTTFASDHQRRLVARDRIELSTLRFSV